MIQKLKTELKKKKHISHAILLSEGAIFAQKC